MITVITLPDHSVFSRTITDKPTDLDTCAVIHYWPTFLSSARPKLKEFQSMLIQKPDSDFQNHNQEY